MLFRRQFLQGLSSMFVPAKIAVSEPSVEEMALRLVGQGIHPNIKKIGNVKMLAVAQMANAFVRQEASSCKFGEVYPRNINENVMGWMCKLPPEYILLVTRSNIDIDLVREHKLLNEGNKFIQVIDKLEDAIFDGIIKFKHPSERRIVSGGKVVPAEVVMGVANHHNRILGCGEMVKSYLGLVGGG